MSRYSTLRLSTGIALLAATGFVVYIILHYGLVAHDWTVSPMLKANDVITMRIRNQSFKGLRLLNQTVQEFMALTVRREIVCSTWKMYGSNWEGAWPVCGAQAFIPEQPCTVYSFGINYIWLFEDKYRDTHNCTVRTFDPSMGKTREHMHSRSVPFYPLGLSDRNEMTDRGWEMDTYQAYLTRFNEEDEIIPYLKFDIEHYEWQVLANMLADGVLRNVMQLSFEMHVFNWKRIREYFRLLKGLHDQGFRRWYHRDHGNRRGSKYLYQCDQSYLNINFLRNV